MHMRRVLALVPFLVAATASPLAGSESLAPFDRLFLTIDLSGSPVESEFRATVNALADQLGELVQLFGVREVSLLTWAGPIDSWKYPELSVSVAPCASPVIAEPHVGDCARLFTGARLFAEARQNAELKQALEAYQQSRQVQLARDLAPICARLRNLRQGRAKCTSLRSNLVRSSLERIGTLLITVTDGAETCSHRAPKTLRDGRPTIVVLLPSQTDGDQIERHVRERLSYIQTTAPWAACIPSMALGAHPTEWLPQSFFPKSTPEPTRLGASK